VSDYDLLIIGGGINGAAIAREAALNGLKVLLVEKNDLASATSSASTKLIHGGLRYLEYYEFKLVREALIERERLLKAAPHLIYPLEFVLPHEHAVRPRWMIRAGLFLYDHLGGRMSLPKSRTIGRKDGAYLSPLKSATSGFVYSDAWVDDARLVVLNARDAADNGAEVRTRTVLLSARRERDDWRAVLSDGEVTARALVNAAGPWVSEVARRLGVNGKAGARLIRGSHLIVPRLFEGEHAYILQQPDRRIVFAIPYQGHTLVGTTDIPVGGPGEARISAEETDYLLAAVNRYFTRQTSGEDILSTYAGIRSLYDDGASEARQVTRDYVLELDDRGPPLLSIFGGKITTARHLGQVAIEKLSGPMGFEAIPVTAARIFPGGEIDRFDHFLARVRARWPFLGEARSLRMARAYGSMLEAMIGDRTDLGEEFGAGLSACEVDWLVDREWAWTPNDVLWRRTKLGLTGEVDESRLQAYLDRR
jgi:glycerol-3-phosphate dehydrogenase